MACTMEDLTDDTLSHTPGAYRLCILLFIPHDSWHSVSRELRSCSFSRSGVRLSGLGCRIHCHCRHCPIGGWNAWTGSSYPCSNMVTGLLAAASSGPKIRSRHHAQHVSFHRLGTSDLGWTDYALHRYSHQWTRAGINQKNYRSSIRQSYSVGNLTAASAWESRLGKRLH